MKRLLKALDVLPKVTPVAQILIVTYLFILVFFSIVCGMFRIWLSYR